jgi:hypothetical protein
LAVERGADALRGILDHRNAEIRSDLTGAGHVSRIAIEVSDDHGLDSTAANGAEGCQIWAERRRIDVVEANANAGGNRGGHQVDASVGGERHRRAGSSR